MKKVSFRAILVIAIGLLCSLALIAQQSPNVSVSDKYIISVTAGGVNHTEGAVSIIREDGTGGLLLNVTG